MVRAGKSRQFQASNRGDVLAEMDRRLVSARRYRAIADAIIADQGGPDQCSEGRRQLIKRFAAAAVSAELIEAQLARGEKIDIKEHALLAATLVRISQRIGIDRPAKKATPSLRDYLAAKATETEVAE